ncbi:MAG: TonB-dependent receptor, partial [Chitinophagaceae bacterium]|nr:TonB-dependent receptor [Chitinophagaceae bacterium]
SDNGPFLILSTGINARFNSAEVYNEVASPENQSIRWETTENYNVGLDYGLFNNRLSGTIDYYSKQADDVFGEFSSDPTSGFNSYNANTASILNKGLEIGINSINVETRKFSWRTTATASFNHNKVTEVKQTDDNSTFALVQQTTVQKGYPIDVLLGYDYRGLNDLGQPLVYTKDGKPVLMSFSDGVDIAGTDLIYSGTTTPKYVLGLNNQFTVGRFDLSFLIMYYGGHVMRVEQPSPERITAGRTIEGSFNYWKEPGDDRKTEIPGLPVYGSEVDFDYGARTAYLYGAKYVRKADYIRLRDLILTYRLNASFLHHAGINNTQLRLQAQNLWRYTFSGNDIDPEAIDRRLGNRKLEQQPLISLSLYTNF